MNHNRFVTPEYVTAKEIRDVRKQLGLTQKEFSMLVNCSKATIERWEVCDSPITGPICIVVEMLKKYPDYVESIKIPPRSSSIRLWYMHNQTVCTMIDVNEMKKSIEIVNYTDNLMFRAFGVEENPNYKMYEEFLESRCFPKSRDKIKLVLRDLDLPFYDPFLIIEKTEGRMAEDDFWIRIER